MAKRRTNRTEKMLFVSGLVLMMAVIGLVIYSFAFLSGKLLNAFSGDGGRQTQTTKFDIEGFKKLGL